MTAPLITWLYCPPSRPDRILRALDFAPDAVVYDLEDAVAPPDKEQARRNLRDVLGGHEAPGLPHLQVRINAPRTPWFDEDVALVQEVPLIGSVRVPKVESAEDVRLLASLLPERLEIHALIESATGVENLAEICAAPRIAAVSLGEADLRAQLSSDDPAVMDHIRIRLVIAAASAGIAPPMGSAWLNVQDHEGLAEDTRRLRGQGFLGRTAIHPAQLDHIREAFRPSREEYEDARRVLDAAGGESEGSRSGASVLSDGTFIDRPVILRAQRTVDLWNRVTGSEK